MTENSDRINQLLYKLEEILKKQANFSREINDLRDEINNLKSSQVNEQVETSETNIPETEIVTEVEANFATPIFQVSQEQPFKAPPNFSEAKPTQPVKIKSDLEKFIGENLINKIGIAITVIGVAIGAKYSIEHQLISPLTRIILGYLIGLGLLGFGIKLKKNYENYSAVLVSGAIAILYFITYAAYGFYDLIPQLFAFAMMVIFTAFTVVAAIKYNQQVIAHIGLVGAYAVPFLLSEGSGRVAILFSYIAIINVGILIIAFKKYWKPLYYVSFILSWLIYFFWFMTSYHSTTHFALALTFSAVFFVTFYLMFLAYTLLQKEKFEVGDIMLFLVNAFVFFGIGYYILTTNKTGAQLLGLFTLGNAIIHFGVSALIFKQKQADRNLFFLIVGLVLVFLTIAVPVQLNGNWVTLLWCFEAALLFWIGRTKNVPIYEKLSYPLMFLAFYSLVQDWSVVYNNYYLEQPDSRLTPLFNIHFLTSVLFIAAFVFINYLNNSRKNASSLFSQRLLNTIAAYSIPAILLAVLYYSFQMEISNYWHQVYMDSTIKIQKEDLSYPEIYMNYDLSDFRTIWLINYSLLFFSVLSIVNINRLKNRNLGKINLALNAFVIIIFLTQGLYVLSELRESYLYQSMSEYYSSTGFNIGIRYICFVFVGLMLTVIYKYIKQDFLQPVFSKIRMAFDLLLYTSILWIASSELISWMDIMEFSQSYKIGLSILWGVYALLLIMLGIWKKKKHLRVGAIVLFGVTLIKLFFYDISHLDTISKTIVFVSLGVLLLIISFLYNKYMHLISEGNEKQD